jgi:hypothetical protein
MRRCWITIRIPEMSDRWIRRRWTLVQVSSHEMGNHRSSVFPPTEIASLGQRHIFSMTITDALADEQVSSVHRLAAM